ncbi:GA module, partial [Bifidobacteriaceae bacterium NR003]
KQQIDGVKSMYTGEKGKDSKNPDTKVNITSVEYSVKDGSGYITFKAQGYKDAVYPMSVFFKQKPAQVLPQSNVVSTVTTKQGTKYHFRKFKIQGSAPTEAEKNAAAEQFVSDNYDGAVNKCGSGKYILNQTLKPKTDTSGLSITASDGIQYVQATDSQITVVNKNGKTVITISDPYEKNQAQGGAQSDNTIDNLKKQAKALLQQKRGTDKLSNNDLTRAGIKDADQLNDEKIDSMAQGQTAEKDLRELIRKLTDATKSVYKYNTNPYGVDNPATIPDEAFQAAVKQFLHANYDDTNATDANKIDNLTFAVGNIATLTGKGWIPKAGTSCLELESDSATYGITTVSMNQDDNQSADFKNGNDILFTVPANKLYKKKSESKPSGDKDKLPEMKEKAKEMIERNPNLTPEDKKKFKKQVDDAHDANGVNTALNNANAKAKENKNNTSDPSIQRQISNNKQGTTAQQQADEDKKKKDKEERDKKQEQQLQDDKKKASEEIDKLDNLTSDEKQKLKDQINGNGTTENLTGVATPEEVQKILDDAKNLNEAHKLVKVGELPFLDHGTGNGEDKALNDILGSKSAKDSVLTTLEDKIKAGSTATAEEIKTALDAAKRQNEINEANAKNAGIAKLEAKKAELDAAYNSLTEDQKKSAKEKYDAAITAITNAESAVNKATKPSQIKDA